MKKHAFVTAGLLVVVVSGCTPGGYGPYRGYQSSPTTIGERQHRQRGNIREGAREGDLTRREAERLRQQQRDIAEDRRDALQDDGSIGPKERRNIKRRQRIWVRRSMTNVTTSSVADTTGTGRPQPAHGRAGGV
jgi:hypothetical protein